MGLKLKTHFTDFTDVTLADEDTNSIQGNASVKATKPSGECI